MLEPLGRVNRYGVEDRYPGTTLEYRIKLGFPERASPDLEFIESNLPIIYPEIKVSGYRPWHEGILVNAMEFAHQQRYWPNTIHFTWARKLNRWFIFSTEEALKHMICIKHITTIQENVENLPIITQLLPQVQVRNSQPSENVASDKDSVMLDIKKIKQLDRWLNLFV